MSQEVTIKNSQLIGAVPALESLLELDLPAVESFKASKMVRSVRAELEIFDSVRGGLIEKYASKGEDGRNITSVDPETGNQTIQLDNPEEFQRELRDLLDQETKFDVSPISLEKLGDSGINVKPSIFLALGDLGFIEE